MRNRKNNNRSLKSNGYRSGLEHLVSKQIRHARNSIRYEAMKIQWIDFSIRTMPPKIIEIDWSNHLVQIEGTLHENAKYT